MKGWGCADVGDEDLRNHLLPLYLMDFRYPEKDYPRELSDLIYE
jgi:hypothetical protein